MNLNAFWLRFAFSGTTRKKLWKKLANNLRYHKGLAESIRHFRDWARESGNQHLAEGYTTMWQAIQSGHAFSTACIGIAPAEEILLLTGGERTGQLEQSLLLAADLIAAQQRIKKALIGALSYPALLFGLVIGLLVFVALYLTPVLSRLSSPDSWTGAARVLYVVSGIISSPLGLLIMLVVFGIIAAVVWSLPNWTGTLRIRADRFAPWSMYRLCVGSVWLFTVATLMRAGIPLSEAMSKMTEQAFVSPYLQERVTGIVHEYDQAKDLGESLHDAGYDFPDRELIADLRAYSNLPNFHNHLHQFAKESLDEGIERIEQQAKGLRLFCLSLVFVCIVSVLAAIGSLQQQLTTGFGVL